MMKYPCLLLLSSVNQFASIAHSTIITTAEAISTLCQDRIILLLGETHQEPDSQMIFLALVRHSVEKGERVYVGLEIPADKQTQLDDTLAGGKDFSFITDFRVAFRPLIRNATRKSVFNCSQPRYSIGISFYSSSSSFLKHPAVTQDGPPVIVYANQWAVRQKDELLRLGASEVTASRQQLIYCVLGLLGRIPERSSDLSC